MIVVAWGIAPGHSAEKETHFLAEKGRVRTTTYGDFSAESLIEDSAMSMSPGEINILQLHKTRNGEDAFFTGYVKLC